MSDIHAFRVPKRVVFATGCGRSGTTALRSAISAHPDIQSTGTENNVVGDLLKVCDDNAVIKSRRFGMQVDEKIHESLFARLMFELVFPNESEAIHDPRALFATWLTPESAERAMRLFPESKIVMIVRDGVATVESRLAHPNFSRATFQDQCQTWARWAQLHQWAVGRSDCLVIRHERLVADSDSTISGVLSFLDLPPHPEPAKTLKTKRFHPTPEAQRPSWQRWTASDKEIFERICGGPMAELGYPIPWQNVLERSGEMKK